MNIASKRWIAVIGIILLLALISLPLLKHDTKEKHIATIMLEKKTVKTIDLSTVTKPYRIRIDTPSGGYNILEVRPNEIEVIEADCPDQCCVHQGIISDGAEPIVCLPHKLVVKIDYTSHDDHTSKQTAPPDAVTK